MSRERSRRVMRLCFRRRRGFGAGAARRSESTSGPDSPGNSRPRRMQRTRNRLKLRVELRVCMLVKRSSRRMFQICTLARHTPLLVESVAAVGRSAAHA
eukprot:364471-Chlamydomonas_euryale.AAC.2